MTFFNRQYDEYICDRCGGPGQPDHTCPFNVEIHDDYESLCNCCEDCAHECAMDV